MYMQVPSGAGKEDEVGKMTDFSAIVPLLQAIFAILLDSGKTLRTVAANCEAVSTKSARPSPVGGFAVPSSSCSYQTKPRVCCVVMSTFIGKVCGMVDIDEVSTGVGWTKQLFGAL